MNSTGDERVASMLNPPHLGEGRLDRDRGGAPRLDRIHLERQSSSDAVQTADHSTDSFSLRGYTSGFGLGQGQSHRGVRGTC